MNTDYYASLRQLSSEGWSEDVVRNLTAIVCGVGALGSALSESLAAMGVVRIILIDDDRVEAHNVLRMATLTLADVGRTKVEAVANGLRRRFDNLTQIIPLYGSVQAVLGLGAVRRADMVFLCMDNRQGRQDAARMARRAGTPHLSGALDANLGMVSGVFTPGTGCYECTLTERERQEMMAARTSCGAATGAERAPSISTTPLAATITAAWMTERFLRFAHGDHETTLAGRVLISPSHDRVQAARFVPRPDCTCRGERTAPIPEPFPASAETLTPCELLREFHKVCGSDAMIALDYGVVTQETCLQCELPQSLSTLRHEAAPGRCPACNGPTTALTQESFFDAAHPLSEHTFAQLALPVLHPITIHGSAGTRLIELVEDAAQCEQSAIGRP